MINDKNLAANALIDGYGDEMDKCAAGASWVDDVWKGVKGMYGAGKQNVKALLNGGEAFGPKSIPALMSDPGRQAGTRKAYEELIGKGLSKQHAIRATVLGNRELVEANKRALKGLGIVAGGTAAAGVGGAAAINTLTPPRRVKVV